MVFTDADWTDLRIYLQAHPNHLVRLFSELNSTVRAAQDAKNKADLDAAIVQSEAILVSTFDPTLNTEETIDGISIYEDKHAACLNNIRLVEAELEKKQGTNNFQITAFRKNLQARDARWHTKFDAIRDAHRLAKIAAANGGG